MFFNNGFSNLFLLSALFVISSLFIQLGSILHTSTRTLRFINNPQIQNNEMITSIQHKLEDQHLNSLNKNIMYSNENKIYSITLDSPYRINEPVFISSFNTAGLFLWRNFMREGVPLNKCALASSPQCRFSNLNINSNIFTNTSHLLIENQLVLGSKNQITALGVNGMIEIQDRLLLVPSISNKDEISFFLIAAFNDINIRNLGYNENNRKSHLLVYSSKGTISMESLPSHTTCQESDPDIPLTISLIAPSIKINNNKIESDSYPLCNNIIRQEWFMKNKLVGFLRKEF